MIQAFANYHILTEFCIFLKFLKCYYICDVEHVFVEQIVFSLISAMSYVLPNHLKISLDIIDRASQRIGYQDTVDWL